MTSFLRRSGQPLVMGPQINLDISSDVARLRFATGGRVPTPEPETTMSQTPTVGRIVHYVPPGVPGVEYTSQCRAAVVTEVVGQLEPDGQWAVSLCVLNPEGMFFNRGVEYHDGAETFGPPDCPCVEAHGDPFRYCSCGWVEASHRGGTWHWPERA